MHSLGQVFTAMIVRRLRMGTLEVRNITAYVGDFHIFQVWQMTDQPALLVGMDVLSQTRGIAIDYERALVQLDLRDNWVTGTHLPPRTY